MQLLYLAVLILSLFNLVGENACHAFDRLTFPCAHLRWVELALVVIDYRTGTARIMGPMTKEEKVEWDDLVHTKKVLEDGIVGLSEILEAEVDADERADIEHHIQLGQESLDAVRRVIPD